jgi:hypothetical protein
MYDELTAKFFTLEPEEQLQFFKMLDEHAPVLQKLMPAHPLIDHAIDGLGDSTDWAIAAFDAWKADPGKFGKGA